MERPLPLGVWLFGGASILAVATSAAFALDGLAKKSDLDQCKPRCSPDAVDAMSMRFTFADVALGAGVMAGAAAFYLLLTRPGASGVETTPPLRSATRPVPFAAPLARGAAFGVSARF